MHHAHRRRRHEIQNEVPVRDGVHGVPADGREAELTCDELSVDRIGHTRQGAAAQRQHVGRAARRLEPARVPLQHLEVGEHVVGEKHRLTTLEMSVAGQHGVAVRACEVEEHALERSHGSRGSRGDLPRVEPGVGRDLVVPRPRRVQPAGYVSHQLVQAGLDVHVNVFEIGPPGELAGLYLGLDPMQALGNRVGVHFRHDALFRQHADVRDGAGYVLPVHPPVVAQRDREVGSQLRSPGCRGRVFGLSAHRIIRLHGGRSVPAD